MSESESVRINLALHPKQLGVLNDASRKVLLVSGRRFGKSRVAVVRAFLKVMGTKSERGDRLSPPVVLVAMPTLVMAKRVLWRPLLALFKDVPGVEINRSEHRITVPGRVPLIVVGLENSDAVRGVRILHCLVDEGQDVPYRVFTEVLYPAMADTKGSTMFITGTPKGKGNWLYDASINPLYSFHNYPTEDNPFIPRDEIESARLTLPPSVFNQEFRASFIDFEGRLLVTPQITTRAAFEVLSGSVSCLVNSVTIAGVDWGDVNPAIAVVRVYLNGPKDTRAIVVHSEKLGDGRNPVTELDLFSRIHTVSKKWNVRRVYADPSRPGQILAMRTFGKANSDPGMTRAIAGENAISAGIATINAGFHSGSITLLEGLNLISHVTGYHRTIDRSGTFIDKVAPGQNDHELDALRYAVFTFNGRNKHILTSGFSLGGGS